MPGYIDRMKRVCHERTNLTITFPDAKDADGPLNVVRKLGWYYPSDAELESIILGNHDHHLYSFSSYIKDQLPGIKRLLTERPTTRRATLQLADFRGADLYDNHLPALISVQFMIRESKLNATIHSRSTDLLMGLPANLFQASMLNKHLAQELGVDEGSVSFFMNSAHVFQDYDEELALVHERNP